MPLKRILCEPLVHFRLLGVGIFLAGSLIAQRTSTEYVHKEVAGAWLDLSHY
jgi:hypothetical protein